MKPSQLYKLQNDCLKFSISKDETRASYYNTVYHCDKVQKLVSTNGHVMTLLAGYYDETLKGLSINVKEFCTNKREFPNVTHFDISDKYQDKDNGTITVDAKYCVVSKKLNPVYLVMHEDARMSLTYDQPNEYVAAIDSKLLVPLKGATLKVFWNKEGSKTSPLFFSLDKDYFKSWFIIMPCRV